ncbi:hypothetical protein [Rathayibacter rathayi]|uniref:hypothetical protein n=1 Tax=Rathayibacter rathayi TaxID=33887 RepID=UPI0011AFFD29|nr:hypothetical protein [Rathayibacter rathayi]
MARAADDFVSKLCLRRGGSWEEVLTAVERLYGKPIRLVASDNPALRTVTGLWVDTPAFGIIVCRDSDDPHYQLQSARHELAHILFLCAPDRWFSLLLPRPSEARLRNHAAQICEPAEDCRSYEAKVESAIEEVAFALERQTRTIYRSTEELYFG